MLTISHQCSYHKIKPIISDLWNTNPFVYSRTSEGEDGHKATLARTISAVSRQLLFNRRPWFWRTLIFEVRLNYNTVENSIRNRFEFKRRTEFKQLTESLIFISHYILNGISNEIIFTRCSDIHDEKYIFFSYITFVEKPIWGW